MRIILFLILIITTALSCNHPPKAPDDDAPIVINAKGVFILCEGLMGYDNSTLAFFNLETQTLTRDFFSTANPKLRIGDTANDMIINNDTAFVALTGSTTLEYFSAKTGKHIDRIKFNGEHHPRKIAFINDSIAYITALYTNSVLCININQPDEIPIIIPVGPNPEYIVRAGNDLLVANSALGYLNANHPQAGTISVIDIKTNTVTRMLSAGPNVIEVIYNEKSGKLYSAYLNTYRKGEIGGIIEYSAQTYKEIRRWECFPKSLTLSHSGDTLFFINQTPPGMAEQESWKGISIININNENSAIENIITNSEKLEFWNALSISPQDNSIWIANAMNFQNSGEILIFDKKTYEFKSKITNIGLNPNKILFYL